MSSSKNYLRVGMNSITYICEKLFHFCNRLNVAFFCQDCECRYWRLERNGLHLAARTASCGGRFALHASSGRSHIRSAWRSKHEAVKVVSEETRDENRQYSLTRAEKHMVTVRWMPCLQCVSVFEHKNLKNTRR